LGNTVDNHLPREGPVKALLRLTETAGFSRSTDGGFYAHGSVGSRRETHVLRSAAFRDWLIDGYFRTWREIPSDWSMRRVLGALEATARFEGGAPSSCAALPHNSAPMAYSSMSTGATTAASCRSHEIPNFQ